MLLLYQTLNSPEEEGGEENCLPLGNNVSLPAKWSEIRKRTHGLISKGDTCFVWNGAEWDCVQSEEQLVRFQELSCIRVRLLPPQTGARFKVVVAAAKPPPAAAAPTAPPTKQEHTLDETLNQVGGSLRNTFSSFAKSALSATDAVAKAVNDVSLVGEKRVEQIGAVRFRLGKKLAEGGFSEVFLAKEEGENRPLAIKRCLAQTPEQLDQLKKEIRAHALFTDSPYILQLLASEVSKPQVDGRLVHQVRFVFPLCAGGSWFDTLGRNLGEEEHIGRIFLGAALGLQHMHAKGILHRDVKPHNILLTGQGHPLVMDLGSSCEFPIQVQSKRQASDLQEDAAQNCSAPYRAPELFEPTVGRNIGSEADAWSLGCTLFAMVWGKGYSPFEDATQGVLKLAILNGSAVRFPSATRAEPTPLRLAAQQIVTKSVVHGTRMTLGEMIQVVQDTVN
ncbi:hypothetical protein BASA81_010176 [Batrachochytrium salamandrivorans]|nr:hypothetical protein BASA81_010176 [Batrachochytrium salamandrivorans]